MTSTLENLVVLTWLRLIHVDLPRLVKQRCGTELCTRTLAPINLEIWQTLTSLLDEIRSSEDARVMGTTTTRSQIRPSVPRYSPGPHVYPRRSTSNRVCPFCKQAGRSNFRHFLSECTPYQRKTDVIWRTYDRSSTYLTMKTNRTRQNLKSPIPK